MAAQKGAQKRNVSGEKSLYEVFSCNLCHFGIKIDQKQAGSRVKNAQKGSFGCSGGSRRPNVGGKFLMLASVVHQFPVLLMLLMLTLPTLCSAQRYGTLAPIAPHVPNSTQAHSNKQRSLRRPDDRKTRVPHESWRVEGSPSRQDELLDVDTARMRSCQRQGQ